MYRFCSLALVVAMLGCGGDSDTKPTAKVTGKVTYNGAEVKGGTLTFRPTSTDADAGKPATGNVGDDGTFTLSTYDDGDGAVLGEHEVAYSAPSTESADGEGGGEEHVADTPQSEYAGLVPKEPKQTVAAGTNDFTIELVKP